MLNSAEIEITCPVCQNIGETSGKVKSKKCFYSPAKDVWHCFHCSSKGKGNPMNGKVMNFPQITVAANFDFSEELLKAYQEELEHAEEGQIYLRKRLGSDQWKPFGLGFDSGRSAIVIPIRNLDGELCGVKYRYLHKVDPKYISEPGSQVGFYYLAGTEDKVLVVEGEFDAITARIMGFEGHIIAVQTNRLSANQREKMKNVCANARIVYVAGDADEAGAQLLPTVISAGIEQSKTAEIKFPTGLKDIADFAEQGKQAEFIAAINQAKTELEALSFTPFDRIEETWQYLTKSINMTGWSSGFQPLDEKLGGGFIPHMLTALSAPGKTGKTTFIVQLIANLIQQDIKTAFISLEMSPTKHVVPSLLSILLKTNMRYMNEPEKLSKTIAEGTEALACMNLLTFMDRYGTTPAALIDEWIRAEAEKGVKVFFLDHVGYSLLDIRDVNEHSTLSKTLRAITRDLSVHIVAVVQPKQTQLGQRVTKHDLYGSVTWNQDVSQIITLERGEANESIIRVTDSHNPLAKPSDTGIILKYDHETCSLSL